MMSLRSWMIEYHVEGPQTAANDNEPSSSPVEVETKVFELSAEDLIEAHRAGTYRPDMHGQLRKPRVRQAPRTAPPFDLPANDAEGDMLRHVDAMQMRKRLGKHTPILDMACGPNTYRDVGLHLGANGSSRTLERMGRRAVIDAAKLFSEMVA